MSRLRHLSPAPSRHPHDDPPPGAMRASGALYAAVLLVALASASVFAINPAPVEDERDAQAGPAAPATAERPVSEGQASPDSAG